MHLLFFLTHHNGDQGKKFSVRIHAYSHDRPETGILRPMDDTFRNDTEIWLYHLKRGGGHAVLSWLARSAGRPVYHLNNVFSKPFKVRWRREKIFRAITDERRRAGNRRVFGAELEDGIGWREMARRPKEILLLNLENFPLERVPSEPLLTGGAAPIIGRSRQRKTVLVLRDAFNTFASVKRGKRRMRARLHRFYARHWKVYAREFLGETRYLGEDTIMISYNRWFENAGYRHEIAAHFGFESCENGLDEMTGDGGGSSFTGKAFDNRARSMDVFGRWKHFADDPDYRAAFDAETIELSNRIFGDITGGAVTAEDR